MKTVQLSLPVRALRLVPACTSSSSATVHDNMILEGRINMARCVISVLVGVTRSSFTCSLFNCS